MYRKTGFLEFSLVISYKRLKKKKKLFCSWIFVNIKSKARKKKFWKRNQFLLLPEKPLTSALPLTSPGWYTLCTRTLKSTTVKSLCREYWAYWPLGLMGWTQMTSLTFWAVMRNSCRTYLSGINHQNAAYHRYYWLVWNTISVPS